MQCHLGDETKHLLDAVDSVSRTLKQLADTPFYETVLAELPQFIVVGAQSAGKSSVLRRISGVKLPESKTLCTRVSTILNIRRDGEMGDESVSVTLQCPGGNEIDFPVRNGKHDRPRVHDAVTNAQARALTDSETQLCEKHTIVVSVRGPTLPNVTLVDLPGFTTADDEINHSGP